MVMRKGTEGKRGAKETMRSNIKDYILQQIISGSYRPGERIVETRLARELNVSQAPVREAMLELASSDILEERPFSGTYVRSISVEEIDDIFEIRAFIEQYAAKRAAVSATREQFAQMEEVLRKMDPHTDISDFVDLDMRFHELIMDAAGSPSLKRAWSILRLTEWTYLSAYITKASLDDLIEQHRTILQYLMSRDETGAGAYMLLHIKGFGKELISLVGSRIEAEKAEEAES